MHAQSNFLEEQLSFIRVKDAFELKQKSLEDSFLRTGQLTPLQVKNRKILRNAMQTQGFRQLPTEWWHYNACSRAEAKHKYKVTYTENDIFITPSLKSN